MSPWRNSRFGARASISDRSRSTATTLPGGPTCSASQAEIEPLPQPTSSALAPGADAESLEMPAVHRVEQPRHQRQPRALAVEVMVDEDVASAMRVSLGPFGSLAASRVGTFF